MKNLIFLPIEIDIKQTAFSFEKEVIQTWKGLWNTQMLKEELEIPEVKDIVDQLPYSKITIAKYNTQATDVPPHVDVMTGYIDDMEEYMHIRQNEPSGYRVVLEGSTDKLEVFDGEKWVTAKLPKAPFAYVLNSTTAKHRVIGETGRKSLYFRGFLDEDKHEQLIKKNLEKYADYAVWSVGAKISNA